MESGSPGERWLVVTLLSTSAERIVVWDLGSNSAKPVGVYGFGSDRGDVYEPIITMDQRASFETVQVFQSFDSSPRYHLLRFQWPTGEIKAIGDLAPSHLYLVTSLVS